MIKISDKAIRLALDYMDMTDAEIFNVAEALDMPEIELTDEDYRRAWVVLQMATLGMGWRPGPDDPWWSLQTWVMRRAGNTEWSERWAAWPHCNGQAGCWMHYGPKDRWCDCGCRWCRIARVIRRDGRRQT